LSLSPLALGAAPELQRSLPPVEIIDRGEVHLEDDEIVYRPWSTDANPGKVHVVQYLAGTLSASKRYRPFTDQLQARHELSEFHVTTIINLDDAMWGTTGFVVSQIESNKRKYPHSTLVLDQDGIGLETWELEHKSGALALLDKNGKILYFTLQPMSEADIKEMLELVKQQIES